MPRANKGDKLVLYRVKDGFFTTGNGMPREEADREANKNFREDMSQKGDCMVVEVLETHFRDFDPR